MILLKFREELHEPKELISGEFEASKSPGDLRCAQCSKFRRPHVHQWHVVIFMVVQAKIELIEKLQHEFQVQYGL